MRRVYLDHTATTPMRPEVVETVARTAREAFGNPSSPHAEGARARAALEAARDRIAAALGVAPGEVILTSGATEANNLALAFSRGPGRLVTSRVEHPSVLEAADALAGDGVEIERLDVDSGGLVDPAALDEALAAGPALASLVWANNETGVVQPVEALTACAARHGRPLHLDATQAIGRIPVDLGRLPVSLLSGSGHKVGGPPGTGFLVARDVELAPLLRGGPQERGRRGGTENLPGAVGLALAVERAIDEQATVARRMAALRDRLWAGIREKVPGASRNGASDRLLPNTLNVSFEGAAADVLVEALDLDGFALSTGSACASGSVEPSHVLLAMGLRPARTASAVRISLGRETEAAEIDHLLTRLPDLVARVRALEAS